jgi:hypothetical protein
MNVFGLRVLFTDALLKFYVGYQIKQVFGVAVKKKREWKSVADVGVHN